MLWFDSPVENLRRHGYCQLGVRAQYADRAAITPPLGWVDVAMG